MGNIKKIMKVVISCFNTLFNISGNWLLLFFFNLIKKYFGFNNFSVKIKNDYDFLKNLLSNVILILILILILIHLTILKTILLKLVLEIIKINIVLSIN